jgi:AcrR family transcriptional regulator
MPSTLLVFGRLLDDRPVVLYDALMPRRTTTQPSTKGGETRAAIVRQALHIAAEVGLEAVTLGTLADQLKLSKSGLFAHFKSKQALQLAVMDEVVERFTQRVVLPSLSQPRGEPRVRAFFAHHLDWAENNGFGKGCFFVSLAQEYDDQPGPVRDRVVQQELDWRSAIAKAVTLAIQEGHFAQSVDAGQFAFEFVGLVHSYQQAFKLLRDPLARERAERAFERLVESAHSRR